MGLKLIIAPTVEPVTLAEAKLQCQIDSSDADALITGYIAAARQQAEHLCGRVFVTQTWELAIDEFPLAEIRIPRPRLLSIVSVKYDDTNGVEQTLSGSNYAVDLHSEPGWILPAYSTDWPSTRAQANAVRIRYTAGYGPAASDVPEGIKAWMKLRIRTMYDNPGELIPGVQFRAEYVDCLLDPFRVWAI